MTLIPTRIANGMIACAAALLAVALPLSIDLFGPPLALGVFA